MAVMFAGPEYRSYVQLCRELRLERHFEEGDLYAAYDDLDVLGVYTRLVTDNASPYFSTAGHPEVSWLPRLDQWLTMLEEAKAYVIELNSDEGEPGSDDECRASTEDRRGNPLYGYGRTREEAAARLFLSVTGRTVTSG